MGDGFRGLAQSRAGAITLRIASDVRPGVGLAMGDFR
jgi:hypothetical protein